MRILSQSPCLLLIRRLHRKKEWKEGRGGEGEKARKKGTALHQDRAPTLVGMRACAVTTMQVRALESAHFPANPRPASSSPPPEPARAARSHPSSGTRVSLPALPFLQTLAPRPFGSSPPPEPVRAADSSAPGHKAPRKAGEVIRRTREDPAGSPRLRLPRAQAASRARPALPENGTDAAKLTVRRAGGRQAGRLTPTTAEAPLQRPRPGSPDPRNTVDSHPAHRPPRNLGALPPHQVRQAHTAAGPLLRPSLPREARCPSLFQHIPPGYTTPRPSPGHAPVPATPRPEDTPPGSATARAPNATPLARATPWATGGRRAPRKPWRKPDARPFRRTRLAQRARPAPGLSVFP